jgi:cytochrome bd-type quinol oxidase subunit 1
MNQISAVWGLGGPLLLLVLAIGRLLPRAIEAHAFEFSWIHWLAFIAILLFMAYSEGYKGFQVSYSPRVAARARYLLSHSTPTRAVLAPLFCMGFFHAPRRRRITAALLVAMIVAFIVILQRVPQPWRGIVDAGVVLGLAWGVVATAILGVKALTAESFEHDPEVPFEAGSER